MGTDKRPKEPEVGSLQPDQTLGPRGRSSDMWFSSEEDILGIKSAFRQYFDLLAKNPDQSLTVQRTILQLLTDGNDGFRFMTDNVPGLPGSVVKDNRFKSGDWEENPFFKYIRDTYLQIVEVLLDSIGKIDGLDDQMRRKVEFYSARYFETMSPSNFILTNPEVLRATFESGGQNLIKGATNFLSDFSSGEGFLKPKKVDECAFELGRNIATSKGAVIFQNRLMQLIQYEPIVPEVYEKPLLIVPPWINKFYILDLSPENSFIKWATNQGLTVYVISWVNPDEKLSSVDFDDYGKEGFLEAVEVVVKNSAVSSINVLGYCLGGTLLGTMLAVMQSKGDPRVNSATFLTTMLDFSEPGDLGVFVDDENIELIEDRMEERGYLAGKDLAVVFDLIRATDLIWYFFVQNYLLGKDPVAFDILFWNSDTTRLPVKMHSTYLRNMYLENRLVTPNSLSVGGVEVDLDEVLLPTCFVSAIEDHIAPWQSTLAGAKLMGVAPQFILTEGGHVAGIVNPPGEKAYCHRILKVDESSGQFLDNGCDEEKHQFSWWISWLEWVKPHSGRKIRATPVDRGLILERAPGHYVKKREFEDDCS